VEVGLGRIEVGFVEFVEGPVQEAGRIVGE
jgi:hypothetical protein